MLDRTIILYADDFDHDVWEEYCDVVGVSHYASSITIKFNHKDVEADEEYDEDENDDMNFDDAMDILDELELDDTAYDYYKEALEGIHYNDQASHETHGYTSLSAVIADARSCEEINAAEDEEEDEEEE